MLKGLENILIPKAYMVLSTSLLRATPSLPLMLSQTKLPHSDMYYNIELYISSDKVLLRS